MVHFCCVPGCSNRSDRETHLSFRRLPLKKKLLLKQWIHKIGRKNLPICQSTRVCSEHFSPDSRGRLLRKDEVPCLKLPPLPTRATLSTPRRPLRRHTPEPNDDATSASDTDTVPETSCDVGIMTDLTMADIDSLEDKLKKAEDECIESKNKYLKQEFRLENISDDASKVKFFTGFSSFAALIACFNLLGPSVDQLSYRSAERSNKGLGRKRTFSPLNEFFLMLVRLRLGLFEQDLAYRFGISQSSVSRLLITWINFVYLQFKEIPLWPPKALIVANMPTCFKVKYPATCVIIDATEIFVEQPALPELQQLTFSNYKNDNTYKGLIGISPSGAVTFISDLFPGSISDKELTRQSGILKLLEKGDSVMADRGFDIEEDLDLLGVRLNMPPFLKGKKQLDERELVETRRIATLRIHVEWAMEQLKNFHIFDRPLTSSFRDTANQVFFVCAILTNFCPSLCKH